MTKPIQKIKKLWEDKTGVSPIIAVILMVAITVVLAATIYVWVSGFGGGSGTTAALSLRQESYNSGAPVFEVQDVEGGLGWEDIIISVEGSEVWNGNTGTGSATITSGGSTGVTTGAINAGDTIAVSGTAGQTMTIKSIDSGSVIYSADIHY